MRHPSAHALGFLAAVAGSLVLLTVSGSGQQPAGGLTKPKPWAQVPRTPDGKPDLQGTFNAATLTPIERPDDLKGRLILTEAEARRISGGESQRVESRAQNSDPNRAAPVQGGNVGGYNNFWIDRGQRVVQINGQFRSSLIVDPADGRVPAQTAAAQKRNSGARGTVAPTSDAAESVATDRGRARTTTSNSVRSASAASSASARPRDRRRMPNDFYNNLKQIVQTPDAILIQIEMVHDARIVRMDAQASAHAHPQMDGRLDRLVGRRHAGHRDDQLHQQDAVPGLVREAEGHRAPDAHRQGHDPLSVHDRRSGNVDAAVER